MTTRRIPSRATVLPTPYCVVCGNSDKQLDPHHPIAQSKGGTRIVTLCIDCHIPTFHNIMGQVLFQNIMHLATQQDNAAKLCEINPRFIYALPMYLGGRDYEGGDTC